MTPMVVCNYTPEQEGQYIKDDDVVRPKDQRYAVKCSEEVSTWHKKSRACSPTYGNCTHCLDSGPTGNCCYRCSNMKKNYNYEMHVDGMKIFDAQSLATIFKREHIKARADLRCHQRMQHMKQFDYLEINHHLRVSKADPNQRSYTKEEILEIKKEMKALRE